MPYPYNYETPDLTLGDRGLIGVPSEVKPLFGEVTPAQGLVTILPAPDIGYVWVISCFQVSNPNAGGGTATYKLYTDLGLVDQRNVAISTPASAGTTGSYLQGGAVSAGAVTYETTAGTSTVYAGLAYQVRSTMLAPWRSVALTQNYQSITLPSVDSDEVLVEPFCLISGNQSFWHSQWILNLSSASRQLTLKLTRNGVAYEFNTGSTVTTIQRFVTPVGLFPALRSGDTLEAKLTSTPDGNVYAGGAFARVPLLT